MKKTVLFLLIISVFLVCSCEIKPIEPLDEISVEATDTESLSAQIGIEMSVPEDARNVRCSIINDLIGETEFSYDGVIYVHRSSKTYSEAALYGVSGKLSEVDSFELNDEITASVNTVDESGRLVIWYEQGNHHSLYTTKTVGTDILTKIAKDL